jgi:hypothetical protein
MKQLAYPVEEEEDGHAATDVARHLGIRQTSVLQSIRKGRILSTGVGQEG